MLRALLERQTSPNFLYVSPILRSRLRDVLAAQGRRGASHPLNDRSLQRELFREKFCRDGNIRSRMRARRLRVGVGLPITDSDDDWEWNLANLDGLYPYPNLEHFGVRNILGLVNDRHYWAWGPIHVAVLRHDLTALRMLLDHGADADVPCSGACDCAFPSMTGVDDENGSVSPHRHRSVWMASHLAICSMNLTAARLLLTTNSSVLCIGAIVLNPVSLARKPRAGITALQYAAWIGSVRMCKFLLQNLPEGLTAAQYMNHSNRRQQSAIHYAAAGGHIRTVGKFLLERGANFPFYEGQDASQTWVSHTKNDPLLLLCQQFRYNDAKWLVKFCRKLYANQSLDPSSLYTRALASLCKLRGPAECTQLSLRDQQDHLYDLMPKELESKVKRQVEASQPLRVAFGRRLISLGADPNKGESIVMRGEGTPLVPVLDNQYYTTYYTAIQTAAASGFTLMVEMLLSQGADLNITARHRQDLATLYAPPSPEALPLVLAALRTFANWMEPGDSLQTVRVLLEAGASLEDIRGCSILRVLQAKRFRFGYGRQKNWKQKDEDWVRTIEVFLDHGAAWKTSLCNWQKFVKCASIPGGLPLCQRLDHARPFENFDSATRREMLRHAVYSTCSELDNHRFFKARDDHALVLWVLNHCCMDPSKRFFIEPSRIQDIFGEVKNRGWKDIAEVIEPFMKQGQVLHLIPDN